MIDLFIQYDLNDRNSSKFNLFSNSKSSDLTIVVCDANYNIPICVSRMQVDPGLTYWFTTNLPIGYFVNDAGFSGFRYLLIDNSDNKRYEIESSMIKKRVIELNLPDKYLLGDAFLSYYKALYTDELKYLFNRKYDGWFIDIGANLGSYSAAAIKYGFSNILMVEPTPILFESLCETFSSYDGVKITHGVITNDSDLSKNLEIFGSAYVQNRISESGIAVPNYRISELIKKYDITKISLLKLDIEGEEYNVIEGIETWILNITSSISIECHNYVGGDNKKIIDKMKNYGFDLEIISESTKHSEYFFYKSL